VGDGWGRWMSGGWDGKRRERRRIEDRSDEERSR